MSSTVNIIIRACFNASMLFLMVSASLSLGQTLEKTLETPYGQLLVTAEPKGGGLTLTNKSSARIWSIEFAAQIVEPKGKPGRDASGYVSQLEPRQSKRAGSVGKIPKGADLVVKLLDLQVQADYRIEQPAFRKQTDSYELTATVNPANVAFTLANNTDEPIEVIWDESSFIETAGTAGRVVHEGVKYNNSSERQPNTFIPPHAQVKDSIFPVSKIQQVSGIWTNDALLPLIFKGDAVAISMNGREFSVYLRLLVEGKKVAEMITFRIAEASVERKLDFFAK